MTDFIFGTNHGFKWGNLEVQAAMDIEGRGKAVDVLVNGKRTLTIYVSPAGRSVRVFKDHVEMSAAGAAGETE